LLRCLYEKAIKGSRETQVVHTVGSPGVTGGKEKSLIEKRERRRGTNQEKVVTGRGRR